MTLRNITIFLFLWLIGSAVEAQNAPGLFWLVVKPGTNDTSYLLGTLHKYPNGVVKLPCIVEEKLARSKTLYLEMQLDWKMVLKMLTSGTMAGEMNLEENREWTEEDWVNIKEWFVQVQHMDEKDFDRIKTTSVDSRLVSLYLKLYGYEYGAVEDDLKWMAKKRKLAVKGLDKDWNEIQSWYAYYAQRSNGFWETGKLDSLLADGYYGLADMFISYAIQDTASLAEIAKEGKWKDGLSLVEWRNVNWMKQLPALMAKNTFVAVGAAHLFGTNGVVHLLRKAGFECTPVEAHFGGDKLERFIRRFGRQYQLTD
jgi:hypothetical protein